MFGGVVDSAPLLERGVRQLAGLGWIGKHTLLLNRESGSWFFLAALLTDRRARLRRSAREPTIAAPAPPASTLARPDAFVAPYVLDARKCLSYTTIELREADSARAARGTRRTGSSAATSAKTSAPGIAKRRPSTSRSSSRKRPPNPLELTSLFDLDDDAFRRRFKTTPLWRAKRRGLLRNAAIVLGNQRHSVAIPALTKGLADPSRSSVKRANGPCDKSKPAPRSSLRRS